MKLAIAYRDENGVIGSRQVEAFPTETAGLAIHRDVDRDAWVLTHQPSGYAVGRWPESTDPEAILACAAELGNVADWTVPLMNARLLGNAAGPVLRRWGEDWTTR